MLQDIFTAQFKFTLPALKLKVFLGGGYVQRSHNVISDRLVIAVKIIIVVKHVTWIPFG